MAPENDIDEHTSQQGDETMSINVAENDPRVVEAILRKISTRSFKRYSRSSRRIGR